MTQEKQVQADLFKADLSWFHIFKELVRNETWAELSANAKAVYPVIKAFVNWESGAAFPSIDTLEKYSGISRPSVVKALKELEQQGLLAKESRKGKGSNYTMIEKFAVQDHAGKMATGISFDYKPRDIEKAVAEIKRFLANGLTMPDGKTNFVKVENLTLNIAFDGGKNIANTINIDALGRKQFIQGIRDMLANKSTKEARMIEQLLLEEG